MEIEKTPQIRFKGFTDDWEQRELGEVAEFHDEKRKPIEADRRIKGIYPYYGASGIIDYVESYLFDGEMILLSEDGANIIDRNYRVCFLASGKYWVNNHAHILKSKDNYSNSFICESLERLNYEQYNTGTAQPKLNQDICKRIIIVTTGIAEQTAIGTFFATLDNLITCHQRKCDKLVNVKKSLLEKMFPKNGEKVPKIRFDGFTDDWEQRELGEVSDRVTRKNPNLESTLPLTISAQYGLVDQITYFNNRVASRDVSNYYLMKNGEFAYNKSYSEGFPFGAIKCLNHYDMGVLSTLYIVFKPNPEIIKNEFLESYYDTNNWHKEVAERAAEGARNHGLLNISADEFLKTRLQYPTEIDEQTAIGTFFATLDNLITCHQRELEKLKNIKKSLLEKMFV